DVGSRSHWACTGFATAADSSLTREFPAHTDGLKAIVSFLREHQVNTIAMESTGIYRVPLYELLQAEGFEVLLVDPGYSRQLRARAAQADPPRVPVDPPAAPRRPAGRALPPRRAGLPAARLPAAAGQPGPPSQPARAAHAEGPGADEPQAN